MAKLSDVKIGQVASQAGFRGPQLVTAIAVALAESGGRSDVYNGSCCYGLWQIHRVHGHSVSAMKDPLSNAKMAFTISKGGTTWQPWEAYTNGAYKRYEARAKKAVSGMSGGALEPSEIVDAGTGGPELGIPIQNLANTIRKLITGLTDGGTWIRVALIVGGLILFTTGIGFIAADLGLSSNTLKKIGKVTPIKL